MEDYNKINPQAHYNRPPNYQLNGYPGMNSEPIANAGTSKN